MGVSDESDKNDGVKNIIFFIGGFMIKQIPDIKIESNQSPKSVDNSCDKITHKMMQYRIACQKC